MEYFRILDPDPYKNSTGSASLEIIHDVDPDPHGSALWETFWIWIRIAKR